MQKTDSFCNQASGEVEPSAEFVSRPVGRRFQAIGQAASRAETGIGVSRGGESIRKAGSSRPCAFRRRKVRFSLAPRPSAQRIHRSPARSRAARDRCLSETRPPLPRFQGRRARSRRSEWRARKTRGRPFPSPRAPWGRSPRESQPPKARCLRADRAEDAAREPRPGDRKSFRGWPVPAATPPAGPRRRASARCISFQTASRCRKCRDRRRKDGRCRDTTSPVCLSPATGLRAVPGRSNKIERTAAPAPPSSGSAHARTATPRNTGPEPPATRQRSPLRARSKHPARPAAETQPGAGRRRVDHAS